MLTIVRAHFAGMFFGLSTNTQPFENLETVHFFETHIFKRKLGMCEHSVISSLWVFAYTFPDAL